MSWIQWRLKINGDASEPLEALLLSHGAVSITYLDAVDRPILEPDPGEIRLWDELILVALFEADIDRLQLEASLSNLPVWRSVADSQWENLEDRDWVRAWMDDYKPMQFGSNLWVCPTTHTPPDEGAVNIMLDPGLAFGSGTHPTTALCLTFLEQRIQGNETIIDFGCGSGILAIAAVKLGAKLAIGTDHDPQALLASRENAERNDITETQFSVLHSSEFDTSESDGVVANILAETLRELAPQIVQHIRPGGWLAMSGILKSQSESVKAVYEHWVDFDDDVVLEDWVLLTGIKK